MEGRKPRGDTKELREGDTIEQAAERASRQLPPPADSNTQLRRGRSWVSIRWGASTAASRIEREEGVVVAERRKDRVTAAAVVAMEAEERAVVVATAAEGKEHARLRCCGASGGILSEQSVASASIGRERRGRGGRARYLAR